MSELARWGFALALGVPVGLLAAAVWWLGFTAAFHTFWALVDGVRWLVRLVVSLPSRLVVRLRRAA